MKFITHCLLLSTYSVCLIGCTQYSSTKIELRNLNVAEYEIIKKDMLSFSEKNFFECQTRDGFYNGELLCEHTESPFGVISVKKDDNHVLISYTDGDVYLITLYPRVTKFHKQFQKVLLSEASKYKSQYEITASINYQDGSKKILEVP